MSRPSAALSVPDTDPDGPAELGASDIDALTAALASRDALAAVLTVVERVAIQRMGAALFTASTCEVDSVRITRVHSSRPDTYPLHATTSKRERKLLNGRRSGGGAARTRRRRHEGRPARSRARACR